MKELSAGILFFTSNAELLLCRMTEIKRRDGTDRWDIPKGHVEPGETPAEAAIREAKEECGIDVKSPIMLKDLGQHKYADNKDIHLFIYDAPVPSTVVPLLECTAFHTKEDGTQIPEMDAFAFIHAAQWKHFMGPALLKILAEIYND